jgi:hypothetical protein
MSELQYRWRVAATFDGVGDTGTWGSNDGGDIGGDATKDRPGGALFEVSYGGPPTVDDLTLERTWNSARDRPILAALFNARLVNAEGSVSLQELDTRMVAVGTPIVFRAVLIGIRVPKADSNSTDTQRWGITASVNGMPTLG